MKYVSKLILITGIGTIIAVGCDTAELHSLNRNSQTVNQINLNFFFTTAQLGAASGGSTGTNRYIDWITNIGICSYAIQQLSNAGGGIAPGDKYTNDLEPEPTRAPFEILYGDELQHLAEVMKQTGPGGYDEGKKVNLRNAARILRAFLFARLTDYYGSIPYFEALRSTASTPILWPSYNKQKEVYADILKELDEASTALNPSGPDEGFGTGDLFYRGNIANWKKWGYSLMLRAAMKISNVDPASANTYVAKAVAGGVFSSNDDNVWVPMAIGPDQWTNQNGISRAFYPGDGGQPSFMSKRLVGWLKGANAGSAADDDPRLFILSGGVGLWTVDNGVSVWTPTDMTPLGQKGMPNGMDPLTSDSVDQDLTYSKINYKMLDLDDPYMLMNYGEVELLLAEASERSLGGLTPAAAHGHYNAGVKASMQMYTPYDASLTVSDSAVTAYLTAYPYGVTKPALKMIGEQLWVNHFFNWWEAWTDWRRTGFPDLVPINYPGNVTGGTIPQRLKYPSEEVSGNPNFEVGSTKPNLYTTKLWLAGGAE